MVVAFLSAPARGQQPPQDKSTSPAAPDQTVHAVLRHTAFRHRSSQRMRSRIAHRPGESIDPEVPQPLPRKAVGPVKSSETMFPAGQPCYSFVDVGVDSAELVRRVTLSEVGTPTPQDGVEIIDDLSQIESDSTRSRQVTD